VDVISSVWQQRSRVVGFADDDPFKRSMIIKGHRVLGTLDELERILQNAPFNRILIAARSIEALRRERLEAFASSRGIEIERFESGLSANGNLQDARLVAAAEPQFLEAAGD
jgi:FlaA1/EpsC-like NDP-sugar epimerase